MKKLLAIIFIIIYGFSFFTTYNDSNSKEVAKYYNIENNLNDSYEILLPLENSSLSKEEIYEIIKTTLENNNANIFFTREENDVTVKYIYITDINYFNNYKLANGSFLEQSDMDTIKYLSSFKKNEINEVGMIATFSGRNKFEIRTLKSMAENDYVTFNGYCIVQIPQGNINDFTKELKSSLQLSSNINIVDKDIIDSKDVSNTSEWVMPIGYLLIMLLVLYEILHSYKDIGVQRLAGYSIKEIYLNKVKEIIKLQLLTTGIVLIILSLILFRTFNLYTIDFFVRIILSFIKQLIIIIIVSSFPFIYLIPMNVSNMIKNKRNTRDIVIFNIVIKSILLILVNVIGASLVNNYNNLNNYYDYKYKEWDRVENYVSVSATTIPMEMQTSEKYLEDNENLYKELNEKGAIYADFSRYTPLYKSSNSQDEKYKCENVTVNPNYLKMYNVQDVNGNIVNVADKEKKRVLLVPESYINQEDEIKNYFKFIYTAYANEKWIIKNLDVDIIWIKDNQDIFSYDIEVNPEKGNMVNNAIISIITENNAPAPEYDRIICCQGNPVKIPKDNSYSLKGLLNDKFKNLSDKEYKFTIVDANEAMASKVKEVKKAINYSFVALGIVLGVIILICFQNVYNYFEQNRKDIFIRAFHGYSFFDKYSQYYKLLIGSQLFVVIASLLIVRSNIKIIFLIWSFSFLTESLVSYLILKFTERNNIAKELKVG